MSWIIETLGGLTFIGMLILTHEFGHYLEAKHEGIYKGWAFLPNPHIKMTRPYNSRWKYLSGIAGSILSLPLFFLAFSWEYWWMFPILSISAGALDFVVVIGYGTLKKDKKA